MPTIDEIDLLVRARYPIIYVVTWEEKRASDELQELAKKQGKKLYLWSQSVGFTAKMEDEAKQKIRDPIAVLEMIIASDEVAIYVLKDFHPYMTEPAVIRLLRDAADKLKTSYKSLIILSPVLRIPPELEKDLTVVDYQVPDADAMRKLLNDIIDAVSENPRVRINLKPPEKERLVQAAMGLTAVEAENAFSRVLVSKGSLSEEDIDAILAEKKQVVRKSGLLEYYDVVDEFDHVGGLKLLKEWLVKRGGAFSPQARSYGLPEPRGILLVGVQGCGKSLTAKAVSNLWKLPLLRPISARFSQAWLDPARRYPSRDPGRGKHFAVHFMDRRNRERSGRAGRLGIERRRDGQSRVRVFHNVDAGENASGFRDRDRQQYRYASAGDNAQGAVRRNLLCRSSEPG